MTLLEHAPNQVRPNANGAVPAHILQRVPSSLIKPEASRGRPVELCDFLLRYGARPPQLNWRKGICIAHSIPRGVLHCLVQGGDSAAQAARMILEHPDPLARRPHPRHGLPETGCVARHCQSSIPALDIRHDHQQVKAVLFVVLDGCPSCGFASFAWSPLPPSSHCRLSSHIPPASTGYEPGRADTRQRQQWHDFHFSIMYDLVSARPLQNLSRWVLTSTTRISLGSSHLALEQSCQVSHPSAWELVGVNVRAGMTW
ncbi:uncharacterized protein B0I36DRAFT_49082 [Microdochium trichocladiopsis]|uniref:Uncharacterized protein n=1 Tax=Microdochium trichocladiopsis TaxID=1682393 RepID=A0A9P8XTH3_9PEZI|nr:uncharacterized protein B0I36DRAFT_49082 [Microdochium trichocladiopsis]KAH7014286.1 hypothetical protein B0I36DRAFT_49082 [Microdochium trichocladiopsis]